MSHGKCLTKQMSLELHHDTVSLRENSVIQKKICRDSVTWNLELKIVYDLILNKAKKIVTGGQGGGSESCGSVFDLVIIRMADQTF